MESNITNGQYFDGASPLGQPHFDEEATLLSARPVVPLRNIKAKERSAKRLVFGLAMAGSLMVGALGATLIYKQRGQGESPAIVNRAVPAAAGIAVEEPVSAPSIAVEVGSATGTLSEFDAAKVDKKSAPLVSRSTASTVVETKRKKAVLRVDQRKLRRAERINARRFSLKSEREAQREFGSHQRKSSDGLLRIREIFEGPSKP